MERPGLEILSDEIGTGEHVERRKWYVFRFRVWLKRGDPVVWDRAWGTAGSHLEDEGKTLFTKARVDREFLYNGFSTPFLVCASVERDGFELHLIWRSANEGLRV